MRQDRPGLQGLCVLSPPAARSPAPPLCLTSLSFPSVRACGRRSAQRTSSRAGSWRRGRGGAGRSRSPAPPSPAQPGSAPGGGRLAARGLGAETVGAAPRARSAAGAWPGECRGGCGSRGGRGRGGRGVPRGHAGSCGAGLLSERRAPSPARPHEVPDAPSPVPFTKPHFGSPVTWIQDDPFFEIPSKFVNVL